MRRTEMLCDLYMGPVQPFKYAYTCEIHGRGPEFDIPQDHCIFCSGEAKDWLAGKMNNHETKPKKLRIRYDLISKMRTDTTITINDLYYYS